LVGATGIGLLVLLVTEIYLNWSTIWPKTQAVFTAFAENVGSIAAGLGKIIYGALIAHDLTQIKAGYDQLLDALKASFNAQAAVANEKSLADIKREEETLNRKKAIADKEQALRDAKDERERETLAAKNELILLETEKASTRVLDIKKQEVELLSKIEDDKNAKVREQLEAQLEETQARLEEAQQQETIARQSYQDEVLASNEQYQQLTVAQQQAFQQQQQQSMVSSIETRQTAQQLYVKNSVKTQIDSNNQRLQDELKFGKAYALINQMMHSEIYQGSKSAFGELAQLQTSSNATLKAIGKAAAVANIVIKTAESAMNIYSGFSTIPFIGQALGIAGAAAAIAFGAEQIGRVTGAAEGGLITGGIRGVDSVPAMLQHGELVAPTSNFEEVIGSVRAQREAQKILGDDGSVGGGGVGTIEIVMKENFAELFEVKILERQKLNISLLETT
jgi:chemotaxis protein histidine kinase CheA